MWPAADGECKEALCSALFCSAGYRSIRASSGGELPRAAVCWLHGMPGDFSGSHPSYCGECNTDLLKSIIKLSLSGSLVLKSLKRSNDLCSRRDEGHSPFPFCPCVPVLHLRFSSSVGK